MAKEYVERELREMLDEHWTDVSKAGKHQLRYGPLTPESFAGAIIHTLSLRERDIESLMVVLKRCSKDGIVDLAALKGECLPPVPSPRRVLSARARRGMSDQPPYATRGDEIVESGKLNKLRLDRMRAALLNHCSSKEEKLTRLEFIDALEGLQPLGISREEAIEVLAVMDPKRTGFVSVTDFCNRFAKEYLKPKSMRNSMGNKNNDGITTTFEWPGSLETPPAPKPQAPKELSWRVRSAGPTKDTRAASLRRQACENLVKEMGARYHKALSPRRIPHPPSAGCKPTAVSLGNRPARPVV